MNTIKVPFDKLRRIVHCADIHVRLIKRHKEYEEAFQQFYDDICATDLTGTVIFVAGDIVHSKTDLSPEMVRVVSDFLGNLSSIAPTLVIAGNHDLNLANKSRLDALSPIVNNIKNTNLHYLATSGVYRVANADFAIYSLLDKDVWPKVEDCTADVKIAAYHGPIVNSETDVGYVIRSGALDVSFFDGYDMVLLGDIHKHQILQEYSEEE